VTIFHAVWRFLEPKGPGRAQVHSEIPTLVQKMAAANPLWGAPRVHGELLKLGCDISERTVSRLMPKRRKGSSQTWKTFLTNHVGQMVSIDFFTVPTLQLRVLFVLVILAHRRRRVVHFNVTEHPTAAWTAQQIVEAFPDDSAPWYLVRDRDGDLRACLQRKNSWDGCRTNSHRGAESLAKLFRGADDRKHS
jgi:putative transposase